MCPSTAVGLSVVYVDLVNVYLVCVRPGVFLHGVSLSAGGAAAAVSLALTEATDCLIRLSEAFLR